VLEGMSCCVDIKHATVLRMEAHIRSEFELSVQEYMCLLRALQSRFGVRSIEDVAFLSAEQLAAVTDRWEAAAVKRIFEIVTTHIGVEKLHRSRGIVHKLDLASDKRQGQEEVAVSVADHTSMDETV